MKICDSLVEKPFIIFVDLVILFKTKFSFQMNNNKIQNQITLVPKIIYENLLR